MPTVIYIGPAGWSYEDWKGRVYPERPPKRWDALTFISTLFNCVEINSTFYRPCPAAMAEGWVRKVAARPDFLFTVKLWERFTHGDAAWSDGDARQVQEGITPLFQAGKLGALLMQFAWNFRDSKESRDRIRRIVDGFAGWAPLVVEVRHISWLAPEAFAFLAGQKLCFANIDQPKSSTSIQGTSHVTGPVAYLRLHGRNARAWFDKNAGRDAKYDYLYSMKELEPFAASATTMASQAESLFVITNNHFQGKAVINAIQLAKLISGLEIPMPEGLK
jgi:uncharacterized protein YecE (DUF72 family)